jgi:hypothetical protein
MLVVGCHKQKNPQGSRQTGFADSANTVWPEQTNLALAEFVMRPQAEALQIGADQMLRDSGADCQMQRKPMVLATPNRQ